MAFDLGVVVTHTNKTVVPEWSTCVTTQLKSKQPFVSRSHLSLVVRFGTWFDFCCSPAGFGCEILTRFSLQSSSEGITNGGSKSSGIGCVSFGLARLNLGTGNTG